MQPDINALLTPISPEAPTGNSLEYEQLFDDIRLARESDPDDLQQGDWAVSEPRKADWNRVRVLCENALREQTKDLQLACWFVEAQCHLLGLAGLQSSIEFLCEFITRFWFQCWPSLTDEGVTIRRSKLLRLDRDLSQVLFRKPLLHQPETSLLFWRQVLAFEHKINTRPGDRDELIRQEGELMMEKFDQKAIHFSSIEIGQQAARVEMLVTVLAQLESRYLSLSQDPDGTVFKLTKQTLAELTDYLQRLTQRAIPQADEVIMLESVSDNRDAPHFVHTPVYPAPQILDRELAISQMLAIAGYFRQTEPSSPVPFLMERAARWTSMTLQEWLEEMLNDSNSINEINNVLRGPSR